MGVLPFSMASSLGVGVEMLMLVDWVISAAAERMQLEISSWLFMSVALVPKGMASSFPFE